MMKLHLREFSKRYGMHHVLDIPDLTLHSGLYWIKGENGSGKSTLFKSLAGLIPFAGDVELNESISLKKHPVQFRKLVNYAEAEPLFPGFLSAKDLVQFIARTKQASNQQKEMIIPALGVDAYMDQSCGTFSSGMLKKLSLTLAFMGDPKIILLDEPIITLDEQARHQLTDLIQDRLKQNTIIIISSHQQLELSDYHVTQSFLIQNKTLVPL